MGYFNDWSILLVSSMVSFLLQQGHFTREKKFGMWSSLFGSPSCPIGNRSNYSRLQGNLRMKTRRSSILVWWVANATATLNSLNSSVHKLVKFDMWPHLFSSWKSLCGLWAPMRERKVGSLIFSYPIHFDNFHQSWKSKKLFSCFGLRRVAENELIEKTSEAVGPTESESFSFGKILHYYFGFNLAFF